MKTLEQKAIEYAEANTGLGLSKEMAIRAYIAGACESRQADATTEERAVAYARQKMSNAIGRAPWYISRTDALIQKFCGRDIEGAYADGATDALQSQWISVEDRLPEEEDDSKIFDTGLSRNLLGGFLVRTEDVGGFDFEIAIRKSYSKDWIWFDCEKESEIKNVTHWMLIPRTDKP